MRWWNGKTYKTVIAQYLEVIRYGCAVTNCPSFWCTERVTSSGSKINVCHSYYSRKEILEYLLADNTFLAKSFCRKKAKVSLDFSPWPSIEDASSEESDTDAILSAFDVAFLYFMTFRTLEGMSATVARQPQHWTFIIRESIYAYSFQEETLLCSAFRPWMLVRHFVL